MRIDVELRWVRSAKTTTEPDRLQWRVVEPSPQGDIVWRSWADVPVVITESE